MLVDSLKNGQLNITIKMQTLNREQIDINLNNLQYISIKLGNEIDRLIMSSDISADIDGYYPLSLIYKVALENISKEYSATDKKTYKNLQKF